MNSPVERQSKFVPDRQSVDIEGLRERLVNAYAENHLWKKLSMAQKLRQLIEERLDEIEAAKKRSPNPSDE
ncbi:hypothetical protein [Phormidesmis sp. 146-33]